MKQFYGKMLNKNVFFLKKRKKLVCQNCETKRSTLKKNNNKREVLMCSLMDWIIKMP